MQTNKNHIPSIALLFIFIISILALLLFAFITGTLSLVHLFSDIGDPAGEMIGSFAFGLELLILLVSSWFVYQKARGNEKAELPLKIPFSNWHILATFIIILFALAIGAGVALAEIKWLAWIFLPTLTLFVIIPPIWLLFGLGTKGIEIGPRWRFFGALGLGLSIGPFIMIVLEGIILLAIIIAGSIFLAVNHPELIGELQRLSEFIQIQTDQEVILRALAPYIGNPLVIGIIIGYIAVIVPMIEELLKPLAVWVFARKMESPAQGFAIGMLSGGAFALIESLNASGNGSAGWPAIVVIRAGTSLLHMTTTGLVGWGIASAFRENKIGRLILAYLCAVTMHGIWNASAIGAGISAIGEFIGKPEWVFNYIPAAVGGMTVLMFGMFAVLIASNRKLTKPAPVTFNDATKEEEVK